jgi:hypothetical protein
MLVSDHVINVHPVNLLKAWMDVDAQFTNRKSKLIADSYSDQ